MWMNVSMDWSKLVEKITTEYRTYETLAEYKAMTKDEQSRIKGRGRLRGRVSYGREAHQRLRAVQICTLP